MKFNIDGVDLDLYVDSAISDMMVPLSSPTKNVGPALQHTPSEKPVSINYKGNDCKGVSSEAAVTIPDTRITGVNLPVIAVEKQSADLIGINERFNGIFGFGHSLLSNHHTSTTAIDVLYSKNVIPNNEVGLQLCPYEMSQESFINIGNTDITPKCGTDGRSVAWVESPSDDHFAINIKDILVNDKPVNLPAEFQKTIMENGHTLYSVVETCSAYMQFPKVVVAALVSAILDSGAITAKNTMFRSKLDKDEIQGIFWGNYLMPELNFNINWDMMPTISVAMFAENPVTVDNRNSIVMIELGPKDYMQIVDSKYVVFAIKVGSNDNANLGIPFMTRLVLTFDRKHKRIGLGPGCGCETITDGYPIISTHYQVLWPSSQLPKQPSTSGSDGTFIRRRKPTTTTDQVAVPEKTHHTVKSHKQTLNKLD
ncbi:hypothetical protein QVD99_005183 [Batrachochytrium dendrobatidis]|nr:hypothetical protein QVD99_005183 [Batrachochytrium dendrobatidis]